MSLLPEMYLTPIPPFQEMIDERNIEYISTINHCRKKHLKQQIKILKDLQKTITYEKWEGIKLDNLIILNKQLSQNY